MWILMLDIVDFPHNTTLKKSLGDSFIRFPNIEALPVAFSIFTILIEYMNDRNLLFLSQDKVFLAVCWRKVNNSRTRISGDVICCPDFVRICSLVHKKWLVL